MIKNIVKNVAEKTHFNEDGKDIKAFDYLVNLAAKLTSETGNKHVIERVLDYTDFHNGEPRYNYSFDLIELIDE